MKVKCEIEPWAYSWASPPNHPVITGQLRQSYRIVPPSPSEEKHARAEAERELDAWLSGEPFTPRSYDDAYQAWHDEYAGILNTAQHVGVNVYMVQE